MHLNMDVKALKLKLIQQISQCNDADVLATVAQVLDAMGGTSPSPSMGLPPLPNLLSPTPPASTDLLDIQASIDEVFGTNENH
jgi:hypothetical protein